MSTIDLQSIRSSKRLSPSRTTLRRMILVVSQVWSWLFLGLVIAYFSVAAERNGTNFFGIRNSQNILVAIVPILLLGMGQTYVMISGGIDLSVGWVMGLASVCSARIMSDWLKTSRPGFADSLIDVTDKLGIGLDATLIVLGLLVALGVAVIAGFTNGVLIAKLHIPPFIVTLGVSFVARGIGWIWSKGNVVPGLPVTLRKVGNNSLMYIVHGDHGGIYFFNRPDITGKQLRLMDKVITWPVLIAFIMLFIAIFVLKKTQFGRYTYSIGGGSNREASLRAGVPVDRHLIMIYTLSGLTAGMAGFLYNARFMGGAADAGEALLMLSIAAVVIGGVSMFGGEGRMSGTLVGALIMAVLQTGLIMIDVETYYQYVVVGIIIILTVLIDQARDLVVGRAEAEQVQ